MCYSGWFKKGGPEKVKVIKKITAVAMPEMIKYG